MVDVKETEDEYIVWYTNAFEANKETSDECNTEVYLEPSQMSVTKLFCKSSDSNVN